MGKGFSDFTYGVGLEISAQSFKQVKDDLKLNLDNLSKMVKSYGKVLKIDPDADLSKLFGEMRKLQGIVDGINNSDNSFAGFVDKGLLSRIETLENSLKSVGNESKEIRSNLSELKSSISSIIEPLKAAGQIKFQATFDNLFGDIQDQSSKIKQTVDQIDKLSSSIKALQDSKSEFNKSADVELDDDVLASQVRSWINEFKTLKQQMSSGSKSFNLQELESNVLKLSELGQKINAALGTWEEDTMKNLGFPLDGKEGIALNNFLLSIPKQIDNAIRQIEAKKSELSTQLNELYSEQAKYDAKISGQKPSGKSLGIQSDYSAQVKITPKANDAEWANIINSTIRNIEGQLKPVHLTPTFSKSKNISKEMEGNLAQINHAVGVDLKLNHNIEEFNKQIDNIDTSIKNAKERLEKNGNFHIKFEYEEGGNFRDVAYKIINQLKSVEVHVDNATSKNFLKELGDLRTKANKELKNIKATVKFNSFNNLMKSVDTLKAGIDSKIGKADILLNISNEPEVIAQATLIRDKLISLFGNVPVNLGVNATTSAIGSNVTDNAVEQLSEAAQEAQKNLEKCRQTLDSLQKLGVNSPHFLELGDVTPDGKRAKDSTEKLEELLNKYRELKRRLPDDFTNWQDIYPEANGNISVARKMYIGFEAEFKKVNAEINSYLQKQMAYTQSRYDYYDNIIKKEKELESVQKTSSDKMTKPIESEKVKKVKSELTSINNLIKDIQTNGFKSSEFLNIGDIDAEGNKVEETTKKLKRLVSEYNKLKNRTEKEKGAGSEQWLKKYPKAKGDMTKVQQLIEKDEKRIQKIESELNQYAQKQIAFLSSRKSALQQVLATEEQITSENTKQAHANKTDVSASSMNQQLAMSAEEAAKKVKSLNGTLTQQKKILKDLEEKGIHSKSFIKLGEWDKKTGSFKKNKQEIQQLVSRYNELKAAREKAGGKKAVGEEKSLMGKLAAILRQQKQHASEIVAQNKVELKTAKEISAAYKESDVSKKKSSKDKIDVDISSTEQKVEQLTQKLNKAKAAVSGLQNGLSTVATTGLGDNKKVLKEAGRTETLKQLVSLYEQLTIKKKVLEDGGILKQSVPEMNSLITSLNQAKQILDKKGLFGLSETGLGDVKGRLDGSSQNLNELVSQYRELLTVKQQLEQSGDTTSESYTSTVNAVKGIENQLKVLRQDQVKEVGSRIQVLEAEIAKKTEYLNVVKECGAIEGILADVHKNQVDYATARIDLYTQQIAKEQELLQIAKQRSQEDTKQVEKQSATDDKSIISTASAASTGKPAHTVQLDGATLSSLAKDSTLQSIDGKIGSILSGLNGSIKIAGSNIVIEASNVSVSGKASDTTPGDLKKTNSAKQTDVNQNLAISAENATKEQKELNAEIKETQKLSNTKPSKTTMVVSEPDGELKRLTETYISDDKVSERTEVSGWRSHGKNEPPTFEHVSTVYKTNMEAYNKMYNDYVKSLAKQMELKAKIQSDDGPTSKMQAELSVQEDITNQLELQLQRHSELYTEQAKQEATLEAAKKAQQEINKSEGAKKDRDVKKQNNELLKIVQSAQNKLSEMQYGMQSSKIPMADGAIAKLKQYEQLLSTLKLKQQELLANPDLLKDADYSSKFNSLLQQMDAVETEFTELQQSSAGFLNKISSMEDIKQLGSSFDPSNLEQMRDAMQEFANQAGSSAAKLIEFNDAERSATFEISDGHGHIQQLTVAYDAATNSLGRYTSKTRESTSETKKFLSSLKHSFQNVARYIASFGSVYELFAVIRQGVTYVRDIDSALTELKKVTDETDASYANFLQDMSSVGKTVGATVKDLTTMSAEWARLNI